MKQKTLIIPIISLCFALSCASDFFRERVDINHIVKAKEKISVTPNPAKQLILKNDLSQKIIVLNNILVKDIVTSPNIDYDFCIISEVDSEMGKVECYIFTKNIRRISMLEKGKTRINVEGQFGRYFSMLDNFYTKVEIIKSKISIAEIKK